MEPTARAADGRLTIDYVAPSKLIPDPRNPRLHKPSQVAAIARAIQTFGFNVPILIDGSGQIIAGHGRLLAASKLGLAAVPVVRVEHLSAQQRQAFAIADNRLTDTSRWDERLLGEVLRDLTVAELDFELDAIGFSVGEIDLKIEALHFDDGSDAVDAADGADEADGDQAIPIGGPAVTQPGDRWLVGRHRLLCGDALSPACWARLMNGSKAQMVFADVPYNVPIRGFVSGLGKIEHREFAVASGEMDRGQFTAFLGDAFGQMAAHSVAGSLHYVCIDFRHMGEMIAAGERAFTELKNMCVWVKPSGSMGSLYRSQHELVFVWKNGRERHRNNVALGKYGRNRTNVWNYPGIAGFRHSEGGDLLQDHPTCKPVRLVADAILDVTARGDIVVDPFMGSGTTLIAAERVGRTACGLELDPHYCDVIVRRYAALTGEQPVLEATGEAFDAVSARRGDGTEQPA
jgi:DNA modification methylase